MPKHVSAPARSVGIAAVFGSRVPGVRIPVSGSPQRRLQLRRPLAQHGVVHYRIPPIDGFGLVADHLHGGGPGDIGAFEVPDGRAAEVVEEPAGQAGPLAGGGPGNFGVDFSSVIRPSWSRPRSVLAAGGGFLFTPRGTPRADARCG